MYFFFLLASAFATKSSSDPELAEADVDALADALADVDALADADDPDCP